MTSAFGSEGHWPHSTRCLDDGLRLGSSTEAPDARAEDETPEDASPRAREVGAEAPRRLTGEEVSAKFRRASPLTNLWTES